jgi:peptidoglycan-associated lipoprotein
MIPTANARPAIRLSTRMLGLLVLAFLAGLTVSACRPKYPACDNDEHCMKGERCLNKMCQQCAADNDCPSGQACQQGRCAAAGQKCNSDAECPETQACKNGVCSPCAADADCGPGGKCLPGGICKKAGRCPRGDEDCPEGQKCINGTCQAPAAPPTACQLENVYFDFNEAALTTTATATLNRNADCIKQVGRGVAIEGHTDPRGTTEYNLNLGQRRADSVKQFLSRYGVNTGKVRTLSKGKEEATGTNEAGWAQDRKAKFIWE